jgi:DNA-binding transcriptional regulator PaaX
MSKFVTTWKLSAQEAAHAMPVLQSVHPGLKSAPAPRLTTIRHLAGRSAIRDGTLRTALSRACATGSLELTGGRYRLGPQAKEEAAIARALLARTSGYTLTVVLEGEDADLPQLRELLPRFGFRPLQRSVWIGARTVQDRLTPALHEAGLARAVTVFHTEEVDADTRARLAKLWDLKKRTTELHKFHRALMDYLTEPRIGAREAAWRCVQAAPVWYRVAVQEEPPFPRDLLGADYPLDALNAAWRAHLQTMTRELLALWKADET